MITLDNIYYKSRRLAFLLRHDTNYDFGVNGWRQVSDLIDNHSFTIELLQEIVATNNKQRFEFSPDGLHIRARQGHSIQVDVQLTEAKPPDTLYHGTAAASVPSIMASGINKGHRLHVHLSATPTTAMAVGRRHGPPAVLKVNARQMTADGAKFYLSTNNVWLTDHVPPQYLTLLPNH